MTEQYQSGLPPPPWRMRAGRHDASQRERPAAIGPTPVPYQRDTRLHRTLHFTPDALQSQMSKRDPAALVVDYTKTMMAFLLFVSRPRRIGMIGLGGGSLAKFCYRELPEARIDAVEVDPRVVSMRQQFHVPDDDPRFRVLVADGADFVASDRGGYDVLLLDAYDAAGIPPRLASQDWYDDCRAALGDGGVLVANLYCPDVEDHVERLHRSFGGAVLVVDEPLDANRVAFAYAGDLLQPDPARADFRPAQLSLGGWHQVKASFQRVAAALARWQVGP